jgi:hypothetical protein
MTTMRSPGVEKPAKKGFGIAAETCRITGELERRRCHRRRDDQKDQEPNDAAGTVDELRLRLAVFDDRPQHRIGDARDDVGDDVCDAQRERQRYEGHSAVRIVRLVRLVRTFIVPRLERLGP